MKVIRWIFPSTEPVHEVDDVDIIDDTEFITVEKPPKEPEKIDVIIHSIYPINKAHWQLDGRISIGWLVGRIIKENNIPRVIPYIIVSGKKKPLLSGTTIREVEEYMGYVADEVINLYLDKNI